MAEGTDNKKPKAQLIKHPQHENENLPSKNGNGEQGERRKVKVVMKKPSVQQPAKKNQPKAVVSTPAGKPAHAKKQDQTEGAVKKDQKKSTPDSGAEAGHVSSYPIAQRPAAAAGRVGGKLVGGHQGPPPQRPNRPPQTPRGAGNKPFNDFNNNRSGQGQRPAGHGGAKPGFTPRPGGGKQGFGGFQRPAGGGRGNTGNAAPDTLPEGKGPAKRKFIAKKPVYNRKEKELEMEEKLLQTKKKITHVANPVPKSIDIMEAISVSELARKMNLKASDLIQKLMSMGQMVTINQQIDADTATLLAAEFGADVRIISFMTKR